MTTMSEPALASPSNPRIKAAARLRERRERDRAGLTLVDGARELRRALEANVEVVEAFICEPLVAGEDARAALDALRSRGVAVTTTTEAAFAKLAFGDRAEGLVAIVRAPSLALADLALPADPLIVVIEGVEKPGNLGAVLRSADGAGVDAVIAASPRTDLANPNVIRASAGTIFTVPMAAGPTDEVLRWLRDRRHPHRGRAGRCHRRLHGRSTSRAPSRSSLGSEADGLTDAWLGPDIEAVHLPMLGVADSLNVSVTAADPRCTRPAGNAPVIRPRQTDPMSTSFDFVVIGAGPGGEAAANKARELGGDGRDRDRRWFGGSCPHVGCIPSKSLLHGAYEHHKNPAAYEWPRASARRDYMVNRSADADEPDDTGHVTALEKAGATGYRGEGRITGRGLVTISHDGQAHELTAKHVVLAVGSVSKRVDMPGLDETKPWTNEEATLTRELPRSLVVLGGGPTGCELAQVYQRFGVPTTIVQSGPRLAPTDHPRNSDVHPQGARGGWRDRADRRSRREGAGRRRDAMART